MTSMESAGGDPFRDQIRAARAEGELAAIKDALREFAEGNGFNPELEPKELLAKASGAFRSRAEISDMRYDEIRELRDEIEAMRPRLMPEGMEWPRYEDGEPVRIGDCIAVEVHDDGGDPAREYDVEFEKFDAAGVRIGSSRHSVMLLHGERVKRPATKALDADGVEINVGDTVWYKRRGDRLTVRSIGDGGNAVTCRYADIGSSGVTAQGTWSPCELTHEPPDSWERIEEDARVLAEELMVGDEEYWRVRDLVRRCRALAGVE